MLGVTSWWRDEARVLQLLLERRNGVHRRGGGGRQRGERHEAKARRAVRACATGASAAAAASASASAAAAASASASAACRRRRREAGGRSPWAWAVPPPAAAVPDARAASCATCTSVSGVMAASRLSSTAAVIVCAREGWGMDARAMNRVREKRGRALAGLDAANHSRCASVLARVGLRQFFAIQPLAQKASDPAGGASFPESFY